MNFTAYDKSELESLQLEVKQRWGTTVEYREFLGKTTSADSFAIFADMSVLMSYFVAIKHILMDSVHVQYRVKLLQDYISRQFYICTPEILLSLGEMHILDNRFDQNIDKVGGK